MDKVDLKLLNLLQEGLSLNSRPFLLLAEALGIEENECLQRIIALRNQGIIRRIGGIFDSKSIGWKSTLCAMKVPDFDMERVAELVNSFDEVTHNYVRDDETYNVWFTITAPSEEKLTELIRKIEGVAGYKVESMPVLKAYKIKVVFKFAE